MANAQEGNKGTPALTDYRQEVDRILAHIDNQDMLKRVYNFAARLMGSGQYDYQAKPGTQSDTTKTCTASVNVFDLDDLAVRLEANNKASSK